MCSRTLRNLRWHRHGHAAVAAGAVLAVLAAGGAGYGALGPRPDPVSAAPAVTRAAAATAAPESAVMVARYGFDHPSGALVDQSGRGHTLRRLTRNGGTNRIVAHGSGNAMAFPRACVGDGCPRAVLAAADAADLNPGTRPVKFGATVRLARDQTTGGQNVLQKGYAATSSQYKLQIDGDAGRPSCVVVDRNRPTIRIATSSRSVADGGWHRVECRRSGTTLAIAVDGAVRGTSWVPGTLSIGNSRPLTIGGKGTYSDNDQFHGAVDDIFVTVG